MIEDNTPTGDEVGAWLTNQQKRRLDTNPEQTESIRPLYVIGNSVEQLAYGLTSEFQASFRNKEAGLNIGVDQSVLSSKPSLELVSLSKVDPGFNHFDRPVVSIGLSIFGGEEYPSNPTQQKLFDNSKGYDLSIMVHDDSGNPLIYGYSFNEAGKISKNVGYQEPVGETGDYEVATYDTSIEHGEIEAVANALSMLKTKLASLS